MSLFTSVAQLLAGKREDVESLAQGDVVDWQALLEHLVLEAPAAAPKALVEAALARDGRYQAWCDRASEAAGQCQSDFFVTAGSALRAFRRWFGQGVAQARPVSDAAGLAARVDLLLHQPEEDALGQVRRLLEQARGPWAGTVELGELLLLLHRRASEERQHGLALEAAAEAEALFRALEDQPRRKAAARARAAALLRTGQLLSGLALLDGLLGEEGTPFGGGGAFQVGGAPQTPRERAADEAATVASWATATTPEWVRALGGLAEHAAEEEAEPLWRRYQGALEAMLEASPAAGEDLEAVLRQLEQRDLTQAAARAQAVGARLGVPRAER